MSNPAMYRIVSHLDEPTRYFTLTVDELVVAVGGLLLLVLSSHKLLVGAVCVFSYGALKHLKQGQGPRFLLVRAYWAMPSGVTTLFLPHLPASHWRVWLA